MISHSTQSRPRNRPPSSSPPRGLRETFERIDEEQLLAAEESLEQMEDDEASGLVEDFDEVMMENLSGLSSIENGTNDSFARKLTKHARDEKLKLPVLRPDAKWGRNAPEDTGWLRKMGEDEEFLGEKPRQPDDDQARRELEERTRRIRRLVGRRHPADLINTDRPIVIPIVPLGNGPQRKTNPALASNSGRAGAAQWQRKTTDKANDVEHNLAMRDVDETASGYGPDLKFLKTTGIREEPVRPISPRNTRPKATTSGIPRPTRSKSPIKNQRQPISPVKVAARLKKPLSPVKNENQTDNRNMGMIEVDKPKPVESHDSQQKPYGAARNKTWCPTPDASAINLSQKTRNLPFTESIDDQTPKEHPRPSLRTPATEDTMDILRSLCRLGSNSPSPSVRKGSSKQNSEDLYERLPTSPDPMTRNDLSAFNDQSIDDSVLFDPDDSLMAMIRRDKAPNPATQSIPTTTTSSNRAYILTDTTNHLSDPKSSSHPSIELPQSRLPTTVSQPTALADVEGHLSKIHTDTKANQTTLPLPQANKQLLPLTQSDTSARDAELARQHQVNADLKTELRSLELARQKRIEENMRSDAKIRKEAAKPEEIRRDMERLIYAAKARNGTKRGRLISGDDIDDDDHDQSRPHVTSRWMKWVLWFFAMSVLGLALWYTHGEYSIPPFQSPTILQNVNHHFSTKLKNAFSFTTDFPRPSRFRSTNSAPSFSSQIPDSPHHHSAPQSPSTPQPPYSEPLPDSESRSRLSIPPRNAIHLITKQDIKDYLGIDFFAPLEDGWTGSGKLLPLLVRMKMEGGQQQQQQQEMDSDQATTEEVRWEAPDWREVMARDYPRSKEHSTEKSDAERGEDAYEIGHGRMRETTEGREDDGRGKADVQQGFEKGFADDEVVTAS